MKNLKIFHFENKFLLYAKKIQEILVLENFNIKNLEIFRHFNFRKFRYFNFQKF